MKKFLSLVLALVMTMSLVVVGASAKTFTDSGKINYKDAVDVISACKIIDGYTDGSFNPAGTLTRGAAAKIICNMILGPTTAAALGADAAPFKDVPVNHTFAGYIAYCAQQGIINGYDDGTFRPAGTVTGYQFMKMLLGALGYDGKIEGFTGANWSINVAKLALNISLDDGNDNFVGNKAMTREEACLYAFNTLKANMVEYDSQTSVVVGGTTVTVGNTKAKDVVDTNDKHGTYKKDEILQFCEKYFDKLTGKDTTDNLGRPATEWKYDGDKVGTYADDADKTMVINKSGLTLKEILVSNSDYFSYDTSDMASKISVYLNGKLELDSKSYADISSNKDIVKAGDQVEIYENDDDKIETIAVIRYSLAKIDEVDSSLSSTYTKKGAAYSVTLTSLDSDTSIGGTYYDAYENDDAKVLPGFAADTYKAGTVLAVVMSEETADMIVASNVATAVSGKISAYDSGSKAKVTLDGTKYSLHANIATSDTASKDMTTLDFNYNDSTYTAYTDPNGYVIGIDETESVKIEDVYYVTCVSATTSGLYGTSYYAQAVALKDGSVSDFKLDKDSDSDNTTNASYIGNVTGLTFDSNKLCKTVAGLYTFEKDGSVYEAKKYNTSSDSTYYVYGDTAKDTTKTILVAPSAISDDLARDDTSMKINGSKVYLNSSTNYVKVEDIGEDISVKFVTGGTSVKQSGVTAIAVCTKSNNNYVASYVVMVSDKFTNTSSDDMVFIASNNSNKAVSYTDANSKTKTGYAYDLYFLDGTGKVEKDAVCTSKTLTKGYYTWDKNDDGVYELTSGTWNDAATAASGTVTESWAGAKNASYDDETGYYKKVTLTSVYDSALTVPGIKNGSYTFSLDDVDFAKNVIIADDRGSSTRDGDLYTSEVNSVDRLKAAIDKTGNAVVADVYYDNGNVVMVYVWSMTKASSSSGTTTVDSNVTKVELSTAGIVTLTVDNAPTATAGASYTVTLKQLRDSGYQEVGTYTVTVAKGATTGTLDLSASMTSGQTYQASYGTLVATAAKA